MAIDLNKFIFISTAIPFGSNGSATVEIPIGGTLTTNREIWSDIIPLGSYNISPRIVYTVPAGTWYMALNSFTMPEGSRVIGGQMFYRASVSPSIWVSVTPSIKYEGNGVRLGIRLIRAVGTGTVTMPAVNIKIEAQWDVIPNSIK